jgi:hypothetical protein
MKIKQKILTMILFLAVFTCVAFNGATTSAATCGTDSSGNPIQTNVIGCSAPVDSNGDGTISPTEKNGAWLLLVFVIRIMTYGVGIAGVGGITYGAIKYATANGNFETAKKALGVITNTGIGLVAYALMFTIMNFIIPGGLLG